MGFSRQALLLSAAFAAVGYAGSGPAHAQAIKLDDVVVSATPLEGSASDTTAQVTVVERDEIVRSGAGSLGALLGDKPGISESAFAGGASRPIIRGLDNFRVRVQENGIGSHDASALSEDHGVPIDPLSASTIE